MLWDVVSKSCKLRFHFASSKKPRQPSMKEPNATRQAPL
jgi:hypothetical protein